MGWWEEASEAGEQGVEVMTYEAGVGPQTYSECRLRHDEEE